MSKLDHLVHISLQTNNDHIDKTFQKLKGRYQVDAFHTPQKSVWASRMMLHEK